MAVQSLTCPFCRESFRADVTKQGQQFPCPTCSSIVTAPATVPASRVENRWYVAQGKQKLGPFSSAQLKQLVANGQIQANTMILRDGQPKWVAAAAIKGLLPKSKPAVSERPVSTGRLTPAARQPAPAESAAEAFAGANVPLARLAGRPATTGGPSLFRSHWPWFAGAGAAMCLVAGIILFVFVLKKSLDDSGNSQAGNTGGGDTPRPVSGSSGEAKKGLDLPYMVPNCTGVIIVHPRRIIQSPLLASMPKGKLDEMSDQSVEESGIDPRKIEQAVVLIEAFPGGNVAFFPSAIVRFSEPLVDKELLGKLLAGGAEEAKFQDKTYYRNKGERVAGVPVTGYIIDDRTLLIAPEPTLHKMLSAKEVKGPLTERLRSVDLDNDVILVGVVEPVRKEFGELLEQAKPNLPPPLAEAANLHEHLKSAVLAVNLRSDPFIRLDLEGTSDKSAAALHELTKSAHEMAKQMYPVMKQQFLPMAPPGVGEPVFAVLEDMLAGIDVKKDARNIVVTMKTPKGLAELPAKLAPLVEKADGANKPRTAPRSRK